MYIRGFENIKKSDRVNSAGRASYVERNCLMIKDSNFVVVHLEEGRNDGKSGSRLAYKYSLRQKKSMLTKLASITKSRQSNPLPALFVNNFLFTLCLISGIVNVIYTGILRTTQGEICYDEYSFLTT